MVCARAQGPKQHRETKPLLTQLQTASPRWNASFGFTNKNAASQRHEEVQEKPESSFRAAGAAQECSQARAELAADVELRSHRGPQQRGVALCERCRQRDRLSEHLCGDEESQEGCRQRSSAIEVWQMPSSPLA